MSKARDEYNEYIKKSDKTNTGDYFELASTSCQYIYELEAEKAELIECLKELCERMYDIEHPGYMIKDAEKLLKKYEVKE